MTNTYLFIGAIFFGCVGLVRIALLATEGAPRNPLWDHLISLGILGVLPLALSGLLLRHWHRRRRHVRSEPGEVREVLPTASAPPCEEPERSVDPVRAGAAHAADGRREGKAGTTRDVLSDWARWEKVAWWIVFAPFFLAFSKGIDVAVSINSPFGFGSLVGAFIGGVLGTTIIFAPLRGILFGLYARSRKATIAELRAHLANLLQTADRKKASFDLLIKMLEHIRTTEALSVVLEIANNVEIERGERLHAIRAFQYAKTSAWPLIPDLIKFLASDDKQLRREARNTLKTISGSDFGENSDRWTLWWKS